MSRGHARIDVPFLLDGDAYTDRDSVMFAAGFEFCMIVSLIVMSPEPVLRSILNENEDRIRVLCSRFRRECHIERLDDDFSMLEIGPGE